MTFCSIYNSSTSFVDELLSSSFFYLLSSTFLRFHSLVALIFFGFEDWPLPLLPSLTASTVPFPPSF